MKQKSIITLIGVIVLITCSNYYFIFHSPNEREQFTEWKILTLEEHFLSDLVLSRYYNAQYKEDGYEGTKNAMKPLKELHSILSSKKEFKAYQKSVSPINKNLSAIDSLLTREDNYLTPFLFTQKILTIQNNLDQVLIDLEVELKNYKNRIEWISSILSFSLAILIVILVWKFEQSKKEKKATGKSLSESVVMTTNNQVTTLQTNRLQLALTQLENTLHKNHDLSDTNFNKLENSLTQLKAQVVKMDKIKQVNKTAAVTPFNLKACFDTLFNYFEIKENIDYQLEESIHILHDKQDILLLLKYLFKVILKNEDKEKDLKVTIRGRVQNKWLHLQIKDNGNQLSLNELKDLFKFEIDNPTYFREDKSITFQYVLVHKLVTDFGGTIRVESIPEYGTTYNLSLPIVHPQ